MRNYLMALGITVLLFSPVSARADGANANAGHYGYAFNDGQALAAGRVFSLAALQEEPPAAEGESDGGALVDKADKTGTNPFNFTYDLRFYHEYQWLNTPGDGHQNVSTVEYRMPFADGKWQFRVKARGNELSADLNDNGSRDVDTGGFGDTDIRFLTIPIMDPKNKFALAIALEVYLDTASDDVLGSGSTVLGPQIFLGFFQPFGLPIDGFFPGYQHQFDVDGNDVHRSLIDLFVLKTWDNKTKWFLADPQIIIDYENNTEFLLLDLEFGTMLPTKGHSAYIRPSVGVGIDRPYDYSFEFGYKIIWGG